jgi:hypothetical protein
VTISISSPSANTTVSTSFSTFGTFASPPDGTTVSGSMAPPLGHAINGNTTKQPTADDNSWNIDFIGLAAGTVYTLSVTSNVSGKAVAMVPNLTAGS